MTITLNGVVYQIDEGSTYTENFNETLDSASVRISHLTQEIDIEPFDDVYLSNGKYMCVDNWNSKQEGLDTPTYSYNITLFSQTKKLENIVLPNISITPRKIGTKLTIKDYLEQYLREYGDANWYYDDLTIFNVECPEMQFNAPTFREVLTGLMMVKDCIPRLSNNKISFMNLSKYNDFDITSQGNVKDTINYITKSQTSDEYVSEARMQLQNLLQYNLSDIDNTTNTCEKLCFTTNNYIVADSSLILETQYPILNITHLWIYLLVSPNYSFKVDLCNLDNDGYSMIKESKEYSTLDVLYRTTAMTNNTFNNNTVKDYFSKYKNFCVYFTRGGNKIEGWSEAEKSWIGSLSNPKYQWLKALAISRTSMRELSQEYDYDEINNGENGYYNTYFEIEYQTTSGIIFSASKDMKPRNKRVIVDNQTNSWVDPYSQGFLEYQKVNRLGNLSILINQRTQDITKLIKIGDTYKDSVVYQTQYQYYKSYTNVNASATKNFVLRNYFTGIQSKIRTWVNAKDEAFERHDLIKKYCEFSLTNKTQQSEMEYTNYFLSPLYTNEEKLISYSLLKTDKCDKTYIFDLISTVVGNSFVLTSGFKDNWIVAKHTNVGVHEGIDNDGIVAFSDIVDYQISEGSYTPPHINNTAVSQFGGIPLQFFKYVDENGECNKINIDFIDEFNGTGYNFKEGIFKNLGRPLLFEEGNGLALADTYHIQLSEELNIHKDNKEIPKISCQYEFCSDNENILVTGNFVKYQRAIRKGNNPQLKLYANSYLNRAQRGNISQVSGITQIFNGLVSIDGNKITLSNIPSTQNYKCVYICDNNGDILLAINEYREIYLNVLESRY